MTAPDTPVRPRASDAASDALRTWLRHRSELHTGLGLAGNVAFVIGSVFFLFESLKTAGVWLFIVGSAGMLIGSIGRAIVETETDN